MPATERLDLIGRRRECDAIDRLLGGVRRGESGALVIRGEAGIGKTALIDYAARRAVECRVIRIEGVESELGLPFAALQELCAPLLSEVAALPEPHGRALRIALGMEVGQPPDLFVVGLAVLILLSDAGAKRPLVVLVDDAQWIDDQSRQVLAFVSRRVAAEAVLVILGVRESADQRLIPGIADLTVTGLKEDDAHALLDAVNPGGLDPKIRNRVVAETDGNPLWLLELSRAIRGSGASGGIALTTAGDAARQLQDHFTARIRALPQKTQRLLQLAAAEPTGDATLVWRSAEAMGMGRDAAGPAVDDELLDSGATVRFRHPLIRSAAYASASPEDRRAAHTALAAATDPQVDPTRGVWHRAAAATGPDEAVASELERAASIAEARAGLAAAAAFLGQSVVLTPDPALRTQRALAGAEASMHAGGFDAALGLLAEAEAAAVDDLQRARVERLRARVLEASNPGRDAAVLLSRAAARLEPLDILLARETHLAAWRASHLAGRHAGPGGSLDEVSQAARSAAPPPDAPRVCDALLDGLSTLVIDGCAAAAPILRGAVDAFLLDQSAGDWVQWGAQAHFAATSLWDADRWASVSARHVQLARASGALAPLSIALNAGGLLTAWCGDFEGASAMIAEEQAIDEVTGIHLFSAPAMFLAAYQGRPGEAFEIISAFAREATARGQGLGIQLAGWAEAILQNGLGHYEEAMAAARAAADASDYPVSTASALPELIEAAVRGGKADLADEALRRLSAETDIEGSDWAAGIRARSRALASERDDGERWYREALERLSRTPLRTELARAHLLYGEWLRSKDRRVEARVQLQTAYDLFWTMGAEAFAERARRELRATGEHVSAHELPTAARLTPQELHIARLARDGRTNGEISSELFLSPRAVDWHLGNVFSKLGVSSREELARVLPASSSLANVATVT